MMRARNSRVRGSRGSPSTCSGGPTSRSRPPSRKHTVSATCRAKPISCVAMSMVMPSSLSSRSSVSTSPTSSGSSAEVTSSSSIRTGEFTSARAMATRCCCPPESSSGFAFAFSARPTLVSIASAVFSASARGTLCTRMGARVTLSSTDRCGKRLNAWNTMPTLARTASASTRGSVMSSPANSTTPSSTTSSRFTQRSSVDLPEPDAPMSTTHSPCSTVRLKSSSTTLAPNALRRLRTSSRLISLPRRRTSPVGDPPSRWPG